MQPLDYVKVGNTGTVTITDTGKQDFKKVIKFSVKQIRAKDFIIFDTETNDPIYCMLPKNKKDETQMVKELENGFINIYKFINHKTNIATYTNCEFIFN